MANAQGEEVAAYMRAYYLAHSTRERMSARGAGRQSKKCRKCGIVKPRAEFTVRQSGPRIGHLAAYCKSCSVTRAKVAKERDPSIYRRVEWPSKLKRLYGITVEDYNRILAEQGGACALCGSTTPESGSRKYKRTVRSVFDVDHNHKTGKVRGLLCTRCNRLVGLANDDLTTAKRLVEYLTKEN
jgi:hypothetical protein